jgi:hypothetical protein
MAIYAPGVRFKQVPVEAGVTVTAAFAVVEKISNKIITNDDNDTIGQNRFIIWAD